MNPHSQQKNKQKPSKGNTNVGFWKVGVGSGWVRGRGFMQTNLEIQTTPERFPRKRNGDRKENSQPKMKPTLQRCDAASTKIISIVLY